MCAWTGGGGNHVLVVVPWPAPGQFKDMASENRVWCVGGAGGGGVPRQRDLTLTAVAALWA